MSPSTTPEQPWFPYRAWYAPHVPLESPEPCFGKTPAQLPLKRRQALAMIAAAVVAIAISSRGLVGAYSADGGHSRTPVGMATHYGGTLIIVAGIVETERDGQRTFLVPAHRNTLQKDPLGSRDQFILGSTSLLEWQPGGIHPAIRHGPVKWIARPRAGHVPTTATHRAISGSTTSASTSATGSSASADPRS